MHRLAKELGEHQGSAWRWRNHKAETAFGAQWQRGGTEQGFHLLVQTPLQLQGCRQEQAVAIYGNRDLSQQGAGGVLAKTATTMDTK